MKRDERRAEKFMEKCTNGMATHHTINNDGITLDGK